MFCVLSSFHQRLNYKKKHEMNFLTITKLSYHVQLPVGSVLTAPNTYQFNWHYTIMIPNEI